jgi:hypothetical protein
LWNGGFITPVQGAGLEHEQTVRTDPESEKDRKTAMVVGTCILVFVAATAVRLIALWMIELGSPGPAGSEARITRSLARENVEVFLIDHVARKDGFPEGLDALVREGVLRNEDIRGNLGSKAIYRKTGDGKGYILR